jgi:hypothetical protein
MAYKLDRHTDGFSLTLYVERRGHSQNLEPNLGPNRLHHAPPWCRLRARPNHNSESQDETNQNTIQTYTDNSDFAPLLRLELPAVHVD